MQSVVSNDTEQGHAKNRKMELTPDKPLFVYFAPGATHAPHHVPKGTRLASKPKAIPDWDKLSADEKKLFTHQAEVFAAYIEMIY